MSGYIGASPVPQATQHREAFTATASQTSFPTVGYTPQFVDVYLNGVKLAAADYTATNGSDIVLATGAAASDILEYVAYTPFEVADQTFTGTTTVDVLDVTGTLSVSSTQPVINLVETDTSNQHRILAAGGSLYIQAADSDGTTDGDMHLTGYTNADLNLLNIKAVTTAVNGNLTVSGGIYLGGTAAANYLDDYEEGTWTPVAEDSSSNVATVTTVGGDYTKVGNTVTLSFVLTGIDTTGLLGGNDFRITGIPFAMKSMTGVRFLTGGLVTENVAFSGSVGLAGLDSTSYLRIVENGSGVVKDFIIVSELTSTTAIITGSITYLTA